MSRCNPSNSHYTAETDTCFSPEQLKTIAVRTGLLRRLERNEYNVAGINLFILAEMLHKHFGTQIGQEAKWLDMNSHIPQAYAKAFRATWPSGEENALLETYDIWTVLSQYENHKYPFFRFLGVHPSDFAETIGCSNRCVSNMPALCNLTAKSFMERPDPCTDFAIVINLDPHTKPGSHWVALYGCVDPSRKHRYGLFYFDSIGNQPPPVIQKFMNKFVENTNMPVMHNNVRRQFGGVQCGVYSISFVVNCVSTTLSYDQICTDDMLNDDGMLNARKFVIRNK